MAESKPVKTWAKTRCQNMVRHRSGVYYARAFLGGKEIWKSLKTQHFSVAEAKLAEFLKEHRQKRAAEPKGNTSAKMTFAQAEAIHRQALEDNPDLKPNTRKYYAEVLAALRKSWPELADTELRKITGVACKAWAARYAKQASSTRFNNTLATLRQVLDAGIEAGVIYVNPAAGIKRARITQKRLTLPSGANFSAFIAEMRAGHSRDSENCADLASGLAFTGCRISEAGQLTWQDIDFDRGEILVRGDAETGTKNWETRRVPIIQDAESLFRSMRAERRDEPKGERVFLVRECQKSMDRAAKLVGMERITHHDLRHLFATKCIESGVDIPTVSRWLGHRDGGALAMRTYGHLRREHSQLQAKKVSFSNVPAENIIAMPGVAV